MASLNNMLSLTLLVVVSALMAAPSAVEAQRFDNYIIIVTGTVRCAVNDTLFSNGTLTSNPFPNATTQLRCGIRRNTTIASTTTNVNGTFSITRDPPLGPLTAFITYRNTAQNCRVVVTTSLSTCNSTLPTNGNLVSSLTQGPITIVGNIQVFSILANNFVLAN